MIKTDERFKKEVYILVKNEYIFLEKYINRFTKLKVKHEKCNKTYLVSPNDFLNGSRCPYCSKKNTNTYKARNCKKKTTEIFIQEVKEKTDNSYEVLGEYINNKTKIKIKHKKCNFVFEVTPHNFISNNTRCPKCSGKYKRTHKDFLEEVKSLVGDEYTVLSEYKSDGTRYPDKIKFRHNVCNNIFEMRAHDFLKNGHRCKLCSNKRISLQKTKTQEVFIEEFQQLVGDEYSLLTPYVNCRTKIKVLHNSCGNTFEVKPSHFLYDNTRCPYCKKSKAEQYIENWLKDHNIIYETQFSFNDCRYKLPLRFDFKLIDKNDKMFLLEYDGIQHYEETWYNDLEIQQKRDEIKNNYCKDNNIKLYRITYKDYYNLNKIMEELNNENKFKKSI